MKIKNLITNGLFLATITACLSGIAIYFSKISVVKIDPLVLTTCRNLLVGALFSFLLFMKPSLMKKRDLKWTRATLMRLVAVGIFGGALPFYLFFTGLQITSALTANYIHKSMFIWVSLLAFFVLKERMKGYYWVAYACLIIAHFVITPLKQMSISGELLILAATFIWSVETVYSKILLRDIEPDVLALFRMGIGGLTLLFVTILAGKGGLLLSFDLPTIVTIGTGGFILFGYNFFWYRALERIPASLATLILSFSVVVGHILNGTFAGAQVTQKEWQTALCICFAVFLVLYFTRKTPTSQVVQKKNE